MTSRVCRAARRTWRAIWRPTFTVLTLVAAVALITSETWLPMLGHWLAIPPSTLGRPADAIVVYGGNLARTLYGIDLYKQGLGLELWHTGYAYGKARITSAIVDHGGVPSQQFHFLPTTSTWSDGQQVTILIRSRKLHSVLIVTDWWHSRRVLCATKQQLQGYNVEIAFQLAPAMAGPEDWWLDGETRGHVVSELVKFAFYAVRYGMNPWGC